MAHLPIEAHRWMTQDPSPSILDLQLQDDTVVSVKFEQGSENISTIGLEVLKPSASRLMKLPMVTSVAFLPKNTLGTTVSSPESIEASSKFMELETLHKHSVLLGMELMVALTEGEDPNSETTGETSREALDETEASVTNNRGTTSVFYSRQLDEFLAMVRFEPNQDGSNSAKLHVGDFDISKSSTVGFRNLKTAEFDCKPQDILSFLQGRSAARTQCPALTKLHLGIDYFVSQEEVSNLQRVLRGSSLLSEMNMTVPTRAVLLAEGESVLEEYVEEEELRHGGGIIIGTLENSNDSGGGGGPISPTSLSPISMSLKSLMYPTAPPSKSQETWFPKSTLNRLSGRQLVSPISPTPTVETKSHPVFLFPAHPPVELLLAKSDILFLNTEDQMMPYQTPPPSDFGPQMQDDWELQWKDGICWASLKLSFPSAAPPVDYCIPEDIKGKGRIRRGGDTQVVHYHRTPGAVTSTGSEDS
ncbi:MAG: hypothetical protein J3R72DRAFT_492127 [Linnemannia gamsii]|nr:MAG: hypothetical protein J3R72DRAFT_492127 [Linnemannia gamsii]